MKLTAGQTLYSGVDAITLVVIRAPADEVIIAIDGVPVSANKPESAPPASAPGQPAVTLLGKRYADQEIGIELLCTKPGAGTLTVDGKPLLLKSAKPLPASD